MSKSVTRKSVTPRRLLLLVASLHLAAVSLMSHSGGTDGAGGHYNRKRGGYHYHHGYSAHGHPDGVCPYSIQVQTNTVDPSLEYPKENAIAAACGLLFALAYRRYRKQ